MTGQPTLEYHQRISPLWSINRGSDLVQFLVSKSSSEFCGQLKLDCWKTTNIIIASCNYSGLQFNQTRHYKSINKISNELNNLVCLSAIFYFDLKWFIHWMKWRTRLNYPVKTHTRVAPCTSKARNFYGWTETKAISCCVSISIRRKFN